MKVTDSTGRNYHGKMGNIIYYTRGKQTYARQVSLPKTGKAERANERSEKQRLSSNRFKTLQVLYSLYKANVSPDIWRQAAREEGKMSSNLFHSRNYRCFDGDSRLIHPESFCFSAGRLLLPPGIQTEAGSDGIFRVSWGKGEEWTTAASSDRLQIGVFVIDASSYCPGKEQNFISIYTSAGKTGWRIVLPTISDALRLPRINTVFPRRPGANPTRLGYAYGTQPIYHLYTATPDSIDGLGVNWP